MIHPLKYNGVTFNPDDITEAEHDMLQGIEVTIHTEEGNKHVSMVLGKKFPREMIITEGVGIHSQVLPTLALIAIDQYTLDNHVSDYAELTKTYSNPFIMGLDYGVRFGINDALEDAYDDYAET